MPQGFYGSVTIDGKEWMVAYWSSLKSDCQKQSKQYRQEGHNSRVIKHPIRMGALAGGAKAEQWAVAVRERKKRRV